MVPRLLTPEQCSESRPLPVIRDGRTLYIHLAISKSSINSTGMDFAVVVVALFLFFRIPCPRSLTSCRAVLVLTWSSAGSPLHC